MVDDFEWDGETIDDGEGENVKIIPTAEPSGNQGTGIDAPGLLSATTDFVNFGVFNGNFRLGPPDPSQDIDVATSTTGSNFMPGWRFIQSSNTNITASQVRNASAPSGSNLRFTVASGAAADEAYAEQIVDIGGNRQGGFPDLVRAFVSSNAGSGTFRARLAVQYLTTDGAITGMPTEQVDTADVAAATTTELSILATTDSVAPTTARYLRIRMGVLRGGAATGATGSLNVFEVRRTNRVSRMEYTTSGAHTWSKPSGAQFVQVALVGGGGGGGGGRRGAAGSVRNGGAGGGGGAYATALFAAGDLSDAVTVTVGAMGAGATGVSTNSTDGNIGGSGDPTSFGTYLVAGGGVGGLGGDTATSVGTVSDGGEGMFAGNVGAPVQASGATGGSGGSAESGAGGGGSGGGITTGDANRAGGDGGLPLLVRDIATDAQGGSAGGDPGDAGASFGAFGGGGGGGGGAPGPGATGRGGAGARGGGGGGGSAVVNGTAGSGGGDGGDGFAIVTAW